MEPASELVGSFVRLPLGYNQVKRVTYGHFPDFSSLQMRCRKVKVLTWLGRRCWKLCFVVVFANRKLYHIFLWIIVNTNPLSIAPTCLQKCLLLLHSRMHLVDVHSYFLFPRNETRKISCWCMFVITGNCKVVLRLLLTFAMLCQCDGFVDIGFIW